MILVTIVNYLGTKIILESGSHLARFLMENNGYVIWVHGHSLPLPPWIN